MPLATPLYIFILRLWLYFVNIFHSAAVGCYTLDSPNSAKEIHLLALYQGFAPHIQNYIDGILEELTIQKTTEKESIVP